MTNFRNIEFRDENRLKLLSVIYNEQKFAFSVFAFLIDKFYQNQNNMLLENNNSAIPLSINKNDVSTIYKMYQELDFTKRNFNFTALKFEENPSLDYIKDKFAYLIYKNENDVLFFDEEKLKLILQEEFKNLSIQDPLLLSNNMKSDLQQYLNRIYLKSIESSDYDREFLYFINQEQISLKDINHNFIKRLKVNKNINEEYLFNFFNDLIKKISSIVNRFNHISIALEQRTTFIFDSILELERVQQLNIITKYLETTMKILKNYYNLNQTDTLNVFIQKIGYVFDLYIKNFDKLSEEWLELKKSYEINKFELISNIQVITKQLQDKKDELSAKTKLYHFFEQFNINNNIDSNERQKEKKQLFEEYFHLNNNVSMNVIPTKAKMELKNDELITYLKYKMQEKIVISEEELEEKREQYKKELEEAKKQTERKLKKDIEYNQKIRTAVDRFDKKIIQTDNQQEFIKLMKEHFYDEIEEYVELFKDFYTKDEIEKTTVLFGIKEKLFKRRYSDK